MGRKALMFVLAVGAVAGFASGIFGCRFHGMHATRATHATHDSQAFEDHIAEVCTRAAERSRGAPGRDATEAPNAPHSHPENTP